MRASQGRLVNTSSIKYRERETRGRLGRAEALLKIKREGVEVVKRALMQPRARAIKRVGGVVR